MNEKNKIVADSGNTITFSRVGEKETPHEVLMKVYYSMREKGYDPVVPVKTRGEIPKDKIEDCMEIIRNTTITAPVRLGEVLIRNAACLSATS